MCCWSLKVGQEKKENVGGNGWLAIDRSFHLERNYPIPASKSNLKLVIELGISLLLRSLSETKIERSCYCLIRCHMYDWDL